MAGLWIEGFETHVNAQQLARKYAALSGTWTEQAGRVFGSSAGPSSAVMLTPSFGTDNTIVLGMGIRIASHNATFNSGSQGFYIETGPDEQCHIEIESSATLGFRFLIKRGSTTVASTSYYVFAAWHYFEFKFTVRDGTDGAYEVRHNGVVDITASGVNLADNATDGWDVFAFRFSSNFGTSLRVDDLYILNGSGSLNDFLGPSTVQGCVPNGDGASTQWTNSSSGTNASHVDDDGTSTTDDAGAGGYVASDTNGQKDLYDFEDLTQISGTIHMVQLGVQLAMASPGTRTVKTVYRDPDTTEADGTSHVVDSTTYDEFTEIFEVNPASAAAWDAADIDDGQFGIEVVS